MASITQDSVSSLTDKFDELSYRWDQISETLEEYEGLSYYCQNDDFRNEVVDVLKNIHHYDTLIYNRLVELSYYDTDKEIKKTIKQIEEFESEYDIKAFVHHLSIECKERREVEREKKNTLGNIGAESYSGQALNVQNATQRYMKHVTYLVDHIRKHIHHLHIDDDLSLLNGN